MAEALAAAGLASSIMTFLDFGIQLAKLTKQIHNAQGELPKDLRICQSTVDDFSKWIRDVHPKQSPQGSALSKADQALKNAVDRCVEDCSTLLGILKDLLPPDAAGAGKHSRVSDFKTALRAVRQNGRIKKAQKALETDKNDLRLCIAERTMALAEENRDTSLAQLGLSKNIEQLQKDAQHDAARTGNEIISLQNRQQIETRQMYTDLTQMHVAGHNENRRIGSSLQQLQRASKEEILACVAQHSLRFDQIHDSLGLMELDLNDIRDRSDDTLLLVKQLANTIDRRADGSAMICIRIPRPLYDPSLSMWNGFRAYTEKIKHMTVPGGWSEEPFHVPDRQIGSFLASEARVSYLAVSPYNADVECLTWTRNLIGPSWSMLDFEAAYSKNQSWLAYLLCYETVAIRPVPLLRDLIDDSGDTQHNTYKFWKGVVRPKFITDGGMQDKFNQDSKVEDLKTVVDSLDHHTQASQLASISNSDDGISLDNHVEASIEGLRRRGTFPADSTITSSSRSELEDIKKGIRRSETLPPNFKPEDDNLDSWIKSMENDIQHQSAKSLKPYIDINKRLLNATSLADDNEAQRADVAKMRERFEQTASHEMPELVQMMTTAASDEADQNGQFKWGFQLVVARNEVHFQLSIFVITMVLVWIFDPVSSQPIQWLVDTFYWLLCGPVNKSFWKMLFMFAVRLVAYQTAVKCWTSFNNLIVGLARRFAAPNVPWEHSIKIRSSIKLTVQAKHNVEITVASIVVISIATVPSSWFGMLWTILLCSAWMMWSYLMVICSLWYAKDWFKLHSQKEFRVYGLGSFLAIVVFTSSILVSIQNKI